MSTPTGRGVLVAGIGNVFLSDDGFGSEVARRLAGGPLPAGVKVVDYGIRGMHLAYDLLDGYDALVVVDAMPGDGSPGSLSVLEVGPDDLGESELDAHGMAPVSVLASLGQLGGQLPPTFVVGCQPADVGEGMGLSPAVAAAVDGAVTLVHDVLDSQLGLPACTVPSHPQERGTAMRTLGIITTVLLTGVALGGVAVGVRSIPDIRRYFRIRSM